MSQKTNYCSVVNRHYPVCMQTAALPRREVSDLLMAMPSRGRFQLFYARRLENGQAKLSSSPRPLPQGHAYLVRQNPGVACMGVRLDAGSTWCYGIDWDCVQCNMHSNFILVTWNTCPTCVSLSARYRKPLRLLVSVNSHRNRQLDIHHRHVFLGSGTSPRRGVDGMTRMSF